MNNICFDISEYITRHHCFVQLKSIVQYSFINNKKRITVIFDESIDKTLQISLITDIIKNYSDNIQEVENYEYGFSFVIK